MNALVKSVVGTGVQCVIFSSCLSAKADEKAEANLSWTFVRAGVPNVLAMSFSVVDTCSGKFFAEFYNRLFVDCLTLAESAKEGRRKLRYSNRRRYPAQPDTGKNWRGFHDWFVPVLYSSSSAPYRIRPRQVSTIWQCIRLVHRTIRWAILTVWVWLCVLLLSIVVLMSLWQRRTSAIEFPKHSRLLEPEVVIASFLAVVFFIGFAHHVHHQTSMSARKSAQESETYSNKVLSLEYNLTRTFVCLCWSDETTNQRGPDSFLAHLGALWRSTYFVSNVVEVDAKHIVTESWQLSKLFGRLAVFLTDRAIKKWKDSANHRDVLGPKLLVIVRNLKHFGHPPGGWSPQVEEDRHRLAEWLNDARHTHSPYIICNGGQSGIGLPTEYWNSLEWKDDTLFETQIRPELMEMDCKWARVHNEDDELAYRNRSRFTTRESSPNSRRG